MNLNNLENIKIPEELNDITNNVYKKNKRRTPKYIAAAVTFVFLLGFTVPGYTMNLPVYSQIFSLFEMENYQKVSTEIGQEVTNKNVSIAIVDAVYSGTELAVTFEVKSDEFTGSESENLHLDFDISIEGQKTGGWGAGSRFEYVGEKTYRGYFEADVDFIDAVPEELNAKVNISAVNIYDFDYENDEIVDSNDRTIKGKWNFKFPITQLESKIYTSEYVAKDNNYTAQIQEILVDDLGTKIKVKFMGENTSIYSEAYFNFENGTYILKDGEIIDIASSSAMGDTESTTYLYKSDKKLEAGEYTLVYNLEKQNLENGGFMDENGEDKTYEEASDKEFEWVFGVTRAQYNELPETLTFEIPFTID